MKDGGGVFLENGPESAEDAEHEKRVNEVVDKIMTDTTHRRRILNAQELVDLKSPNPRFEQFFPVIDAYFYSIDGFLNGETVTGAMMAGEIMLVFAPNRPVADEIAHDGLSQTIKHLQNYATMTHLGVDPMSQLDNAGLDVVTGGRKAH